MNSPRNVELPPWYGQSLSLGVLTSFKLKQTSHFLNTFGEEEERKNAFNHSNQNMTLTKILLQISDYCFTKHSKIYINYARVTRSALSRPHIKPKSVKLFLSRQSIKS